MQTQLRPNRPILMADIVARRRGERISIAAPSDFSLGSVKTLDPAAAAGMQLLP